MMTRTVLMLVGIALCIPNVACTPDPDVPPPPAEAEQVALRAVESDTLDAGLDALTGLWRDGQYVRVLPALLQYRKTAPYGKNEIVDYMIGTSACRIPEKRAMGREFLAWMLQHYPLNDAGRERVRSEMDSCSETISAGTVVPVLLATPGAALSGPGVSGKMYYDITRGEDLPMANDPVEVVREIPADSFAARLFPPSERDAAALALSKRLGPEFRVVDTESFLLASRVHADEGLQAIGAGLENLLRFYVNTYGMTQPEHLISVHLVETSWHMQELAVRIHGLRPSPQGIGYSMREDLSMVGVIPGGTYGTLAHELFHLMVRRDFGDIPPWLDEGMAALYEVSYASGDRVLGTPNWRGRLLEAHWDRRPTIEQLARMDWRGFENADNAYGSQQQMANHATARYFALFLQETGQLVEVFNAFRERAVSAGPSDPADESAALLASVLRRPLDAVDAEFAGWFGRLQH